MPADAAAGAAVRRRLVQRRKALGLTQEALTELVAVGRSTVVRWERGESEPLPSVRPRLARALKVSADLLESLLAGDDRNDGAAPRQLPAAVADFTGRAAELERLTQILDAAGAGGPGTVVIGAIGEMAGVGKTSLALYWAHQVADRFPDGQLYVNLRGLVLVTSRSQLTGLAATDGARLLSLDVLAHHEATELLATRIGLARAAAEPGAVSEIAGLSACLPLAVTIAAARAVTRPGLPLAALADELLDASGRLDALDAGDPAADVRAVFSWSVRQLSPGAARMFRLLGIHPGPDISGPAAASLAGCDRARARRDLGELARAHLITERAGGRYACHDLLRAYAAEQARDTDGEPGREAAVGRVLDHYLQSAAHAAYLLNPSHEPVALAPPGPGGTPERPAGHGQALAWFTEEHQVMLAAITLAAQSGFDLHAWQLAWALAPYLQTCGHWQEWAATQRTALAAATRLGEEGAQAVSTRLLAVAYSELGEYTESSRLFTVSLTRYQRLGDRLGEAKVQFNLAALAEGQGRYADMLEHAEQALRLYQAIGDKASEATALNNVGWTHGLLGDYERSRAFCRQALALCTETGHHWLEGYVWDSLGYAEHHLGNLGEAAACYQRALSLHREAGDRFTEAEALIHLGETRQAAGNLAQAREAWQQALAIFTELHNRDAAARVRAMLASPGGHSHPASPQPSEARAELPGKD